MMEVYEQSIINILKNNGDPQKICSKIALCSTNDFLAMSGSNHRVRRSQQEDLGKKRCTWGPSFWCAEDENALACNVRKFILISWSKTIASRSIIQNWTVKNFNRLILFN